MLNDMKDVELIYGKQRNMQQSVLLEKFGGMYDLKCNNMKNIVVLHLEQFKT